MKSSSALFSIIFTALVFMLLSHTDRSVVSQKSPINPVKIEKMKIEVWSDVVCPFCYIGKRRLESALEKFEYKNHIQIVWKSFQLDPTTVTQPDMNPVAHLANKKGWTIDHTKTVISQVSEMANTVGLDFKLETAVVANTNRAHQLIHFAQKHGKGNEMKESLLQAHFVKGENIDELDVLLSKAEALKLNGVEAKEALLNEEFSAAVQNDIMDAGQLGVRGVPFFVFNRALAISGAQSEEVFFNTLEKAFAEWKKSNPIIQTVAGSDKGVCVPDEDCH